jgi:predicted Zn-dependent protease
MSAHIYRRVVLAAALLAMLGAAACETGSIYRGIPPRSASRQPPPEYYPPRRDDYPPPPREEYSPPPQPQARAPLDRPPVREEDLPAPRQSPQREQPPATPPPSLAPALPPSPPPTAQTPTPPPAAVPDDSSLLAKITPSTPPQRAASLRLTEEGRKLLEAGDHSRALSRLEKTIAIDSTNPYGYFYLAKAHSALGRYQESLRFLDVAEPLFGNNPYWLAELYALRGEDYRALGSSVRAESNYSEALRFNPGNRTAADGIERLQEEGGGRR